MTAGLDSRLTFLAGLAVIGLALAGASVALGVTDSSIGQDTAGEFAVTDDAVTFASDSTRQPVIRNLSGVTRVEIRQESAGQFSIRTEEAAPLTAEERERAKEIARRNATVQRALSELATYDITVDPIRKLSADRAVSLETVPANNSTLSVTGTDEEDTVRIRRVTNDTDDESVVVNREPTYVDGEATLTIRGPGGDATYRVHVDLVNETVVDLIDWTES